MSKQHRQFQQFKNQDTYETNEFQDPCPQEVPDQYQIYLQQQNQRKKHPNDQEIIFKFVNHCATLIQKHIRGYQQRQRHQIIMPRIRHFKDLLNSCINGFKIRKIMNLPEIQAIKSQIQDEDDGTYGNSAIAQKKDFLISRIDYLYNTGSWLPKTKRQQSTKSKQAIIYPIKDLQKQKPVLSSQRKGQNKNQTDQTSLSSNVKKENSQIPRNTQKEQKANAWDEQPIGGGKVQKNNNNWDEQPIGGENGQKSNTWDEQPIGGGKGEKSNDMDEQQIQGIKGQKNNTRDEQQIGGGKGQKKTNNRDEQGLQGGKGQRNKKDEQVIGSGKGSKNDTWDEQPIGGKGQTINQWDEQPVGGKGGNQIWDEQPVGGKGGNQIWDEQPVGVTPKDENIDDRTTVTERPKPKKMAKKAPKREAKKQVVPEKSDEQAMGGKTNNNWDDQPVGGGKSNPNWEEKAGDADENKQNEVQQDEIGIVIENQQNKKSKPKKKDDKLIENLQKRTKYDPRKAIEEAKKQKQKFLL